MMFKKILGKDELQGILSNREKVEGSKKST